MVVPTAKEMAEALRQTGRALHAKKIINSEHIFFQLASAVLSHGADNPKWGYEISESNPIEFGGVYNQHLNKNIRPRIYAAIEVQQTSKTGGVRFDRLDLALDVVDDENNVLIKHHIDLANSSSGQFQDGPLFHLQFGGHTPKSSRKLEVPIKEPRWLCIPLDVILLCEVVVANFYSNEWVELKQLPSWHDPIVASQKLCIVPFLDALQQKVSASKSTLLDHLWAPNLGPSYAKGGFP